MSSSPPPLVQDDSEVRGPHLPAGHPYWTTDWDSLYWPRPAEERAWAEGKGQHRGKKPLTATEVDMAKKLYEQEKKVKRLNEEIKQMSEWISILERYLSIPVYQIADIEEIGGFWPPPPLVQDDSEVREKEVERLNEDIYQMSEWIRILERYLTHPVNQIAEIEEIGGFWPPAGVQREAKER